MAYNNLQNRVTSVETTSFTNGTGLSYSTIASLTSGVPHVDQLEVERIFDLDTNVTVNGSPVNIQDNISAFDLHKIFILEKADYTLNEATSTLTTITIPGNRTYTIAKAKNNVLPVGTVISIPVFSNGQKVIIRRKTLSFDPYVTWTAGTRLTSEQLNLQVQQLLRLNQELIYKMESEYLRVNDIAGDNAPAFDVANSLDMQNNKIINLSDPSSAQDGATKNYVDTTVSTNLANYVSIAGTQTITGTKTFSSGVSLSSTLAVTGATTLTGNATVGGTLAVTGGLGIAGASPVANTINIGVDGNNRAFVAAGGTNCLILDRDTADPRLSVPGNLAITGTGTLSVAGSSTLTGATTLQSTLAVTGATSLSSTTVSSTLGVTGAATFSSTVASTGTVTTPNVKITGTASADVNTLDYYEEGTWTPVISGTSVTASPAPVGKYTRIGNVVHATFSLDTSTISGTPTAVVTGLPFAASAPAFAPVYHTSGFATYAYILATMTSGSSDITFKNVQATSINVTPVLNGSSKTIQFNLTYFV